MRRLDEYREKRNSCTTDEPSGSTLASPDERRFVIQHHDASSEHYDFRLEHDGVLLSSAVPKRPSTDPRDKRLAVRTEDHPVDYLDFEGTIPDDEYGGGSVIVWDVGTWEHTTGRSRNADDNDDDDHEPPSVDEALDDGHLSFRHDGTTISGGYTLQLFRPDDDQWLLIKHADDDDARRRPTSTQPESVRNGVTSFSRLQQRSGLSSSQDISKDISNSDVAVTLYLFDLLSIDGHGVRQRPLRERKILLCDRLSFDDPIRFCAHRNGGGGAGHDFYADACSRGREGLIAKRPDSQYRSGRSRSWLKLKCVHQQEFVIGGYTDPEDDATLRQLAEDLVCEVGFTEWTSAGRLRHPRFLGRRQDKSAVDVVRESPS